MDLGPAEAGTAPVAVSFIVFGMFWGSWAVAITNVKHAFDLSDATLGILLSVAIGIAALNGAVLGHFAQRLGTRAILSGSMATWAVLLVCTGVASSFALFAVSFTVLEATGGAVDAAMNGAISKRLMGKPGELVRFHALFNTGALIGAASSGLLLHAGVSWRWLWPGLSVVAVVLALWTWRAPAYLSSVPDDGALHGTTRTETGGTLGPVARIRADHLLLFLFVFAIAEVTEGGVDTWGVLYLRTVLTAGVLLGAGAYALGQTVAITTRGAGGRLLGRLSARRALFFGALLAGTGILLESFAHQAVVAGLGLALGAAGASFFWPLVMSEVTRRASQPVSAVGAFTASGYLGWVGGAPLIGWVSDAWKPSAGLQLLGVLALLVAVTALLSTRSDHNLVGQSR
jgi:MFS family permease